MIALARSGHAQPSAPDLVKEGLDAYKAGKFDDAAMLLERAYQLEPRSETLFALAQAYRLGGHCEKAIPRYRKLLESATELAVAKAIRNNLDLCPAAASDQPAPSPRTEPPPVSPQTRTVVREVRRIDRLATVSFGAGMLAAGASVGFFMSSQGHRDDAARTRTLDDHIRQLDLADRDRLISYAAAGAGAALIGFAVYRWVRPGNPRATTEVSITPSPERPSFAISVRY